jgi:hypothetical protein
LGKFFLPPKPQAFRCVEGLRPHRIRGHCLKRRRVYLQHYKVGNFNLNKNVTIPFPPPPEGEKGPKHKPFPPSTPLPPPPLWGGGKESGLVSPSPTEGSKGRGGKGPKGQRGVGVEGPKPQAFRGVQFGGVGGEKFYLN